MNMRIQRLSEEEINQIAAGEVIENPASIVKELLENSLDAKAKSIEVFIKKGGQELISIEDDGLGMEKEDVALSVERHATSKIRKAADLQHIATLGFRGEALAAISSVSQFEITSSTKQLGTKLTVKGGIVEKMEAVARNQGTSVFVRDLFFNTPARKKFLKSISSSTQQIIHTVEVAALSHPEIAFRLISNGKVILSLEKQDWRGRIEAVLGPFKEELVKGSIFGVLAAPEEARVKRRGQYFFINRRAVFSPLASKAVQVGYGTRLAEGLFPPFVLFLDLAQSEVDVNVHPQKKEVRFSNEKKVFEMIQEAVESSLDKGFSFSAPLSFQEPVYRETVSSPLNFFSFHEKVQKEDEALSFEYSLKPLCILKHFFLLQKERLILVDLKRARARILFENLKAQEKKIEPLRCPLEIFSEKEEEDLALLEEMGVEARMIGKKRLAIDALFPSFDPEDFSLFFQEYRMSKKIDKTLVKICGQKNKTYFFEEALTLFKALMNCSEKRVDPLGNPIWKELSEDDFASILRSSEALK